MVSTVMIACTRSGASKTKADRFDPLFPADDRRTRFITSGGYKKQWGAIGVVMLGLAIPAYGQQSFLVPGTWEVAAVRNDKFTLTLQVASVSAQGVIGTLGANPYSKCQEAMPVTSSQVEPTRVIVRFLHSESAKVPSGCDRTLTFLNNNGQISVVIDNWNGRNDMKVVKRP